MLTKQGIDVSFAQGLDTKTDPKRVSIGKFVKLENSVFTKGGLLQKRNGYGMQPSLPDTTYSYLTTFNGNLTAVGKKIAALNNGGDAWVVKGNAQPLTLKTLPLIRNNLNQITCDSAVAANGLVCTVYRETNGATTTNKYVIADSATGQNIVAPTAIPVASGTVSGGMRVFYLGTKFILVFTNVIGGTSHLQYVAISAYTPTTVTTNADIAAAYTSASTLSWDGYVVGNNLYVAYNTTSGGQSVKITYLTSAIVLAAPHTFAASIATMMSVTADLAVPSNPTIFLSFYDSASTNGFTAAVDQNLNVLLAPTATIVGQTILNITSTVLLSACQIFAEVSNNYSYDSGIPTHYVESYVINVAGTVTGPVQTLRSVGLASKAFAVDNAVYFLGVYQSPYQPTYFLVNGSSSSAAPFVAAKLAYENGGGYLTTGLPGVTVTGTLAQIPYLIKDQIQAVNKDTNVPAGTQVAGVYSQTGINLVSFNIGTQGLDSAEIGSDLQTTGGFLGMYDGYSPVEQNFFLYPDSVELTGSGAGGTMLAATYYYQVTYEWTDNRGNAFRSAPSIPVSVTTTGTTSSVVVNVPTLRVTMKTANPVKIVIYRWSTLQQNYYQVTSISTPLLNSTSTDSVAFTDTLPDSSILGNNLIYTTGGVVEDINGPSCSLLTLFDTRLWQNDSEDPNLLWYSKQVIESTPVEMSDLFTVYVPPTVGTATGDITALATMDDKLIISKGGGSLVYINGTGPDNTGLNSQYSQPIFITSTVGCANQKSLVVIPQGLMFESNKGIWILGRGLDTDYIGAPVEDFTTGATVTSAVVVPGTNQVRFTLSSGVTLMYDYFYGQWGSFTGVPAVSSCIFEELHTFINELGAVYQETPGLYLDGSNPVLMSFRTGPLRLGELQGYQRAYFFYLLGQYISPHKLYLSMIYDYDVNPSQSVLISPTNYTPAYGLGPSPYGQESPYGGPGSAENWRVFLERQRCMAFAIDLQEIYDASLGVPAGAGLTISGLNVVCAFKKGFRPQPAAQTAG